jgi:hypothetical protein
VILSRYPRGFYAEDNWAFHTAERFPLGQMPPGMSRYSVPVGLELGRFAGGSWVGPPAGSFAAGNGLGCTGCSPGLGQLDVWWPFPGLPMWPTLIGGGLLGWWLLKGGRKAVGEISTRRRRAGSRRTRMAKAEAEYQAAKSEPGFLFS